MTVIIGILGYFFIPMVLSEVHEMVDMIKVYSTRHITIPFLPENITDIIEKKLNLTELVKELESGKASVLIDKGETLVSNTIDLLMHSIEWLLTFIYVIFILIDYKELGADFVCSCLTSIKKLSSRSATM